MSSIPLLGTALTWMMPKMHQSCLPLICNYFDSVTLESECSPARAAIVPKTIDLQEARICVDWATDRNKSIRGHALLPMRSRHLPRWMGGDGTRAKSGKVRIGTMVRRQSLTLEQRRFWMRQLICCPIEEFPEVRWWSVVLEAFLDDGRPRPSLWGDARTVLPTAFAVASQVTDRPLFYDDYLNAHHQKKWKSVFAAISQARASGGRVDGIGIQLHHNVAQPIEPLLKTVRYVLDRATAMNLVVHFSEVQFYVPIASPSPLLNQLALNRQAYWYDRFFRLAIEYEVELFCVWAVTDWAARYYYLLDWTNDGDRPALFDDFNSPKPSFYSVWALKNPALK